jgi:uncharacterized membrane protein (DUF373 family)
MSRKANIKSLLTEDRSLIPERFINKLEDAVHGFLGITLFLLGVAASFFMIERLVTTRPFFPTGLIQAINDILFIVIILEIMRTVTKRFTDGFFQLDSFLIIGVIAAVRHILTVGASLTLETQKPWEYFKRAMMELGVNTGIVITLVFAIFLSRSLQRKRLDD